MAETHALNGYPMRWPVHPPSWLEVSGTLAAMVGELDGVVVAHGLIRRAEGTTAAHSLASASGRQVADIAMVSRLFVVPSARRHGVGGQLLDALMHAAAERDVVLGLDVVDKDVAAIAMYERTGWRRVATVRCDWAPHRQMYCYLAPARSVVASPR
jgi:GNAT superfamily N-acetyltransferase